MNDKEIATTLNMLNSIADMKRYELGVDHDKIRVRIGSELMAWINRYINNLLYCSKMTKCNAIFGYPVEIEYDNPMCLEVHIVETVPIYKEGEADGNKEDH